MQNTAKINNGSSKGFIIPLVIAIIALVAAGGVWYGVKKHQDVVSNTDRPQKGDATYAGVSGTGYSEGTWKTFTVNPDPSSTFQFKFPSNWDVSGEVKVPCKNQNSTITGAISPIVHDAPGYQSTGAYYLVQFCVGDNIETAYNGFIEIPKPGQGIAQPINIPITDLQNTVEYKIAKEIISTIKFTGTTTSMTDWKTYTEEKYNSSFKYPKESSVGTVSTDYVSINLPVEAGTNLTGKNVSTMTPDSCATMIKTEVNGVTFLEGDNNDSNYGNNNDGHWMTKFYGKLDQQGNCVGLIFSLMWRDANTFKTPVREFDLAKESEIFYQILSTFKLSDSMSSQKQSYSNPELGFELTYPFNAKIIDIRAQFGSSYAGNGGSISITYANNMRLDVGVLNVKDISSGDNLPCNDNGIYSSGTLVSSGNSGFIRSRTEATNVATTTYFITDYCLIHNSLRYHLGLVSGPEHLNSADGTSSSVEQTQREVQMYTEKFDQIVKDLNFTITN